MNEDNNLIKTWYFYFKWAGFREKHFFAFDEALETLGVKYIKQNISGNPINIDQLKNQIKAVQSERDRINLFLSEFLDDNVAHQGDRAVKSRKEITWDVINQLVIAFDNPMNNSLFKDISGLSNMTAEYTSEGWTRLLIVIQ
ncbi:hypothetical protein RhiirA1_543319 [Rhizophagus irregularis]|uniref:Uncharacterized protein n=1 Tax=Rhizophagus irregularis TaxID=588596 RepID=A0A2N0QPP9_9GLOM|nr:hypothetical protein RhiirA1_543319 [Rhizophagus irregularis]